MEMWNCQKRACSILEKFYCEKVLSNIQQKNSPSTYLPKLILILS